MIKKTAIRVTASTGNVFRDLGFSKEESEHLLVRADLLIQVQKAIESRRLKQAEAELVELNATLEQRVEERTSELKKRAAQLEAVSSVARTIASVQDINTLLPDISELVSQQFGFYHVGIFLMDETHDFAILRAANSEGGQRMVAVTTSFPASESLNSVAVSRWPR